jgi:hypothetical protein
MANSPENGYFPQKTAINYENVKNAGIGTITKKVVHRERKKKPASTSPQRQNWCPRQESNLYPVARTRT